MVEKLFPDPFLKNQNWVYLRVNSLQFYTFCFFHMPSWGLLLYTETKFQTTCFYSNKQINLFLFLKKSPCLIYCIIENIYIVILCYVTKFHCLVDFALWDIGQYVYCSCLLTRLWLHKFSYLSNQAVFSSWPNSRDKNLIILRMKKALKMQWKAFFITFKGLSLKLIKHFFRGGGRVRARL